ncbi:unnamed protein product [Caretta caretta]
MWGNLWEWEGSSPSNSPDGRYIAQLREELCETCEDIEATLDREKAKCKGTLGSEVWGWQVGDKVMLQKLGRAAHTLDIKWMGLYSVVNRISPVVYQLQLPDKVKWAHAISSKHVFLPRFPIIMSWASIVDQPLAWTVWVFNYRGIIWMITIMRRGNTFKSSPWHELPLRPEPQCGEKCVWEYLGRSA